MSLLLVLLLLLLLNLNHVQRERMFCHHLCDLFYHGKDAFFPRRPKKQDIEVSLQ